MTKNMTPEEIGAHAETRFLRLVLDFLLNPQCPPWLLGALPAPFFFDLIGIDIFVYIQRDDGAVTIVPVQIKSSYHGAQAFHERSFKPIDVSVVIINEYYPDKVILDFILPSLATERIKDKEYKYLDRLTRLESFQLEGRALEAYNNRPGLHGPYPHLAPTFLKMLERGYVIETYDTMRNAVQLRYRT